MKEVHQDCIDFTFLLIQNEPLLFFHIKAFAWANDTDTFIVKHLQDALNIVIHSLCNAKRITCWSWIHLYCTLTSAVISIFSSNPEKWREKAHFIMRTVKNTLRNKQLIYKSVPWAASLTVLRFSEHRSTIWYQTQSNQATKDSNSVVLLQRSTPLKYKMSLETQREAVSKIHLTHNMEIHHSEVAPANWAHSRGAALPLQHSVWKWGWSLGHQIGLQRRKSWKEFTTVALTVRCTKNCCLTDWITARNGGGLKSCKSRSNAVMKEKLTDKTFNTHKEETLNTI